MIENITPGFLGKDCEELEKAYLEVLEEARRITVDRGKKYNAVKSIKDYWRYDKFSPLNFINENFLRLEAAMLEGDWNKVMEIVPDLINYSAHAYCFAKDKRKENVRRDEIVKNDLYKLQMEKCKKNGAIDTLCKNNDIESKKCLGYIPHTTFTTFDAETARITEGDEAEMRRFQSEANYTC